jgi:hypothetical protein
VGSVTFIFIGGGRARNPLLEQLDLARNRRFGKEAFSSQPGTDANSVESLAVKCEGA